MPKSSLDPSPPVSELSAWYQRAKRNLPWRKTRDPYAIWLSEVMLQQTQVATVLPYFDRFLSTFPTIEKLADADEPRVLARWSGLGYYSRARNLHRGAKYITQECGGQFPKTREEILKVPGIGPYTAGAILSIAFGQHEPIVDGNVQRVFTRYYGNRTEIPSRTAEAFLWGEAKNWVALARHPGILNQAIMELGATVCTKHSPECGRCPIQQTCVAFRRDWQAQLPVKKPRRAKVELIWMGVVLEHNGRWFLKKNPKGVWWSDLWDFPREVLAAENELAAKVEEISQTFDALHSWQELSRQRHTVTHHSITLRPVLLRLSRKPKVSDGKWFTRAELADLPISSLVKKVLVSQELLVE